MSRLDPDLAAPLPPGAARARLKRLWHDRPSRAAPLDALVDRLGGDATALDLVAAWTDVATADQLLLVLERQPAQGLMAAGRMSWSLLEPWAQHALQAASTFVAPWCSATFSMVYDPHCTAEAPGSAPALAELVRRRLVLPVRGQPGMLRVRPRLRQVLADRLEPTLSPTLVARHAQAILTLAELSARSPEFADQVSPLALHEIAQRAVLIGDGDLAARAVVALSEGLRHQDMARLGSLAARVLGIEDLGPWRDQLRGLAALRAPLPA